MLRLWNQIPSIFFYEILFPPIDGLSSSPRTLTCFCTVVYLPCIGSHLQPINRSARCKTSVHKFFPCIQSHVWATVRKAEICHDWDPDQSVSHATSHPWKLVTLPFMYEEVSVGSFRNTKEVLSEDTTRVFAGVLPFVNDCASSSCPHFPPPRKSGQASALSLSVKWL